MNGGKKRESSTLHAYMAESCIFNPPLGARFWMLGFPVQQPVTRCSRLQRRFGSYSNAQVVVQNNTISTCPLLFHSALDSAASPPPWFLSVRRARRPRSGDLQGAASHLVHFGSWPHRDKAPAAFERLGLAYLDSIPGFLVRSARHRSTHSWSPSTMQMVRCAIHHTLAMRRGGGVSASFPPHR